VLIYLRLSLAMDVDRMRRRCKHFLFSLLSIASPSAPLEDSRPPLVMLTTGAFACAPHDTVHRLAYALEMNGSPAEQCAWGDAGVLNTISQKFIYTHALGRHSAHITHTSPTHMKIELAYCTMYPNNLLS